MAGEHGGVEGEGDMSTAIDVKLDINGDLPEFTRIVGGIEIVAQRISIRLRTHYGEWRLDNTVGLPFLLWRQTKPPPLDTIAAKVRREVEGVAGVLRVDSITATFDKTSRTVTVAGKVVTDEGVLTLQVTPLGSASNGNRNPAIMLWNAAGQIVGG